MNFIILILSIIYSLSSFAENNIPAIYDKEFIKNENNSSVYQKDFARYGATFMEQKILEDGLTLAKKNNKSKKFNIFYFGSGDGRIFDSIENILSKDLGTNFTLTVYDPSIEGLKVFITTLENKNYKKQETSDLKYTLGKYNKNNLSVNVIHTRIDEQENILPTIIDSKFDYIISYFGVLSHIPFYQNRHNTFKMLNNMLEDGGIFLTTVCSKYGRFAGILKKYDFMRNTKDIILDLAIEEGDIYYQNCYKESVFYHLFDFNSLTNELKQANFNIVDKGVSNTISPRIILGKSKFYEIYDYVMSNIYSLNIFPDDFKAKQASYIYLITRK